MSYRQQSTTACTLLILLSLPVGCRQSEQPQTETTKKQDRSTTSVPEKSPTGPGDDEFSRRYNQAVGLMGQYKYPEAFAIFSELAMLRPDDDDLIVNAAIARMNMAGDGDLVAARELLTRVLSRNQGHLRANYCVGLIDTYLGPPANPIENFRRVAQDAPEDADAAYLYGKALEQAEKNEEAFAEYRRCLRLNPYYASAILGLSRIERMRGDSDSSSRLIADFEAMKSNPNGRVFEFAYRRMGRLGEVVSPTPAVPPAPMPSGPLFNTTSPQLESPDLSAPLESHNDAVEIVVCDLFGNDKLDLILVFDSRLCCLTDIEHGGQLARFPWLETSGVNAVGIADIDQNGEQDVFLARNGPNQLWLQRKGEWQQSADANIGTAGINTLACRIVDSDHDGDVDIVCCDQDGPLRILNNNRDETFRLLELDPAAASSTTGQRLLALGDFDNRRDIDMLVLGASGRNAILWNERLWNFRSDDSLSPEMSAQLVGAVASDLDRDGALELVVRTDTGFQIWKWTFNDGWTVARTFSVEATGLDSFAVADLDGDGNLELLVDNQKEFIVVELDSREVTAGEDKAESETIVVTSGDETICGWTIAPVDASRGYSLIFLDNRGRLRNLRPGKGRHEFAAIQFRGGQSVAESMRSNFSGIGTRWKARVGSGWAAGQALPPLSGPSQSMMPEVIGMQGQKQIDFVAVDWTDGVFQAELAVPAGKLTTIRETQRQLASCPVVYAWNGERIEFVTDVLGVGGIGFMVAPGEYAPSRPWEHLMLSTTQLQPKEDRLVIKVGEPMEEACYLRSARLLSVSLPKGWNYVVDERMGTSSPEPSGELRYYQREYPPVKATSSVQPDALKELAAADFVAPDVGPSDHRFIGLLQDEFLLEFSFGEIGQPHDPAQQALVIDGWVEYPYSQVVFAAWQAGRTYDPPTLEVSRDGGEWEVAWEHFGYPAGMPRRILVPLPTRIGTNDRFRIRSPMQIYWDRIALVELETCPDAVVSEHDLELADVRRVGFPKRSTFSQYRPHYDYSVRPGTWDSRHLPGFYTRFGDVTGLFQAASSKNPLVIIGPGEEVHLEFAANSKQQSDGRSNVVLNTNPSGELPIAGYVLQLQGWCKDVDMYTQGGNLLEPVPDSDSVNRELELKYNSRYESGPWYAYPATKPVKAN
jgi:tetratricopeptide (TPR) repeat protein